MKDIVIVSCYPDSEYKEFLLNDCVTKLKKLNKEVLIATHYPIPSYIIEKVDYYIYDKDNIDFDYRTIENSKNSFYEVNDKITFEYIDKSHSPALSKIFNLALNFINQLDYDYFTIIESDSEYHIDDLSKIDEIKNDVIKSNKNFFFFKLRPHQFKYWEDLKMFEVYETYCFGGLLSKFMEKFYFPKTYDEWVDLFNKDFRNQHLEFYVTEFFKNIKDECLILDSFRHVFTKSNVNTITIKDPTGIYYNLDDENKPVLLLCNIQDRRRYVIRSFECNLPKEITLGSHEWYYAILDITNINRDINIVIYDEGRIVSRLYYVVTKDFVLKQKKTHIFKFK